MKPVSERVAFYFLVKDRQYCHNPLGLFYIYGSHLKPGNILRFNQRV